MTESHRRIEGPCHCRNIHFVLLWPASDPDIPVRQCSCTFCVKRAGLWTSNRSAELLAEVDDPSSVANYRFGTTTASFFVCSIRAVVPFVSSEIDDTLYAVVNVNSFDNVNTPSLSCSSTYFDGEDNDERLERRKRNWIPNVQISMARVAGRATNSCRIQA
jgi:hypothetical protein